MLRMMSEVEKKRLVVSMDEERDQVEERLERLLDDVARGPSIIEEAVRYMVLHTGKRLRPLLCLWTHDAFDGRRRDACLDVACAIECLHTYSLVHDDLPCMDDDDMRRGKPSCHKKYGEAIAVLTGDALLTVCFDILASIGDRWEVSGETVVGVTRTISRAAGMGGLIGGQVLDMTSAELEPGRELLENIHAMKTASLIGASMECGGVLAGVSEKDRDRIRQIGMWAGRAFQIVDDVLDLEAGPEVLGKTPGKDVRDAKLTYPSVVGVETSKREAAALIERAKQGLGERPETELLRALLEFVIERRA
jgi:geranylgeranyl diphosphate synthase type II